MKITNTNKYSLMIGDKEVNFVVGLANAMNYFEGVLLDREKLIVKQKRIRLSE